MRDGLPYFNTPRISLRSSGLRLTLSHDAELLLQAGGRGGVLKNQPLAWIDVVVRLLRHQRAFVEARQDELELARIPVDVADRKNPGHARFERRGVDHDILAVLHFHAPIRDRTELHCESEEWQRGGAR